MHRCILAGLFAIALLMTSHAPAVGAQEDDAIAGRFGGSEDDFTEKYGRPTQTTEVTDLDDASVLSYDVFGFEDVDAVVFDGEVVGLILRPIAGDTWSAEAANTVIGDFGPDDADYDPDESIGDGAAGIRLGRQGSSEAIEDSIADDVYEDLDFSGDPGDFFVTLYQADAPSFYTAVSLTLGTVSETDAVAITSGVGQAAQADVDDAADPPVRDTQQGVSPEEQAYIDDALPIIDTMNESFTNFSKLIETPLFGDTDWTIKVATELVIWQASYQEALTLVAPPAFEELHRLFVEGLKNYNDAADLIVYGFDNADIASINAASELIIAGGNAIDAANDELTRIQEERGL